jgi:hypothetical protein
MRMQHAQSPRMRPPSRRPEGERDPAGTTNRRPSQAGVPLVSPGGERMGRKRKESSSRYLDVTWHTGNSTFRVQLTDPPTKCRRHEGYFASEEDAAKAYGCAAVRAHGPGAKHNFPGEAINEPPVAVGEKRKQERKQAQLLVSSTQARQASARVHGAGRSAGSSKSCTPPPYRQGPRGRTPGPRTRGIRSPHSSRRARSPSARRAQQQQRAQQAQRPPDACQLSGASKRPESSSNSHEQNKTINVAAAGISDLRLLGPDMPARLHEPASSCRGGGSTETSSWLGTFFFTRAGATALGSKSVPSGRSHGQRSP